MAPTSRICAGAAKCSVSRRKSSFPPAIREELEVQSRRSEPVHPFSLDGDSRLPGVGTAPNTPKTRVLIAASRKEKDEYRVAAAEICGPQGDVMDIVCTRAKPFELMGRRRRGRQDQNIAMVDVGAPAMTVNVLRNDSDLPARSLRCNELTQKSEQVGLAPTKPRSPSATAAPVRTKHRSAAFVDKLGLESPAPCSLLQLDALSPVSEITSPGVPAIPGVAKRSLGDPVETVIANPWGHLWTFAQSGQGSRT